MLALALLPLVSAFSVTAVGNESHPLHVNANGLWVTDQGHYSEGFNAEIGTTGQLAVNGNPVHIDMGGYYVARAPDAPYFSWQVVDGKLEVNGRSGFFACPEYDYQVGSVPIGGSQDIFTCKTPIFVELRVSG